MPAGNDFPIKFVIFTLSWIFGSMTLFFAVLIFRIPAVYRYGTWAFLAILVPICIVVTIRETYFKYAPNIFVSNERIIKGGRRVMESICINRVQYSPMCIDPAGIVQVFLAILDHPDVKSIIAEIHHFISMDQKDAPTDEQHATLLEKLKEIQEGTTKIDDMTPQDREIVSKEFSDIFTFKDAGKNSFHADLIAFTDSEAVDANGDPISRGMRMTLSKTGMHDGAELFTQEVPMYTVNGMPTHTRFAISGSGYLTTIPMRVKQDPTRLSGIIGGPSYNYTETNIEIDGVFYSTRTLREGLKNYTMLATTEPEAPSPWYATVLGNFAKIMDGERWRQRCMQLAEAKLELENIAEDKLENAFTVAPVVPAGGSKIPMRVFIAIGIVTVGFIVVGWLLLG